MTAAQPTSDESRRLEVLRQYAVLDTLPDRALDDLTALAAQICEAPIALISLVDENRQWFKARVGLELAATARDISFCGHAVQQRDLFIVPDAARDERFAENPMVLGEPGIRFYAGVPLVSPENTALGALCVIDRVPRTLQPAQEQALRVLARQVMTHLELRRQMRELVESEGKFRLLAENITDVFWITSPDLSHMHYVSPSYKTIWGRSVEELYAHPHQWIESIVAEDRERVYGIFGALMENEPAVSVEYRIARPDGSIRWVHDRGFQVRDAANRLVRLTGIAADVTARKQAETDLREAHEKLNIALEESQQQTIEAAWLTELVDVLQSCKTVAEAYNVIGSVLRDTLRCASGALFITSPSRDVLEAVTTWGEDLGTEKTFLPDECWGLRRGKIHKVKDSLSPLRCEHVGSPLDKGSICVPLAAHGEALGLLFMTAAVATGTALPSNSPDDARPDALDILGRQAIEVAERISLALGNLRLREVLRNQSIYDTLTGLYNRRFMEESLEREMRRAVRGKQKLALLLVDIDQFKGFNDMFGHLAGDALLRSLGQLLKQRTRGQDIACRYGGEEFAFILSGATMDTARKRAEILREDIKLMNVQHSGQLLGTVTLSIGISAFPENGESADALLEAADAALYRAKEEGRDRIIVAPALLPLAVGFDEAVGPDAHSQVE